ncbi:MAG: phage major capsid protein [Firmicutes bacterium]|jgi:hypothetical protein|nr:phage major capsid protein [Bacillota bacterium]DAN65698.1 MAG TPA: major capsid protein [Caudoviricetes sp.]
MITLSEAENALKNIYLGTMSNLLNTTANPLLAKIEQTQADVYGNEIRTAVRWGINGGVGAGDEDGDLPVASGNKYLQFTSTLKNLYGQISISDKAIRAGREGMGAFTDLLNAEITGLMEASKFNLARMLYGDGTGFLTSITAVTDGVLTVQDTNNLIEGMLVDVYSTSAGVDKVAAKIVSIDRTEKKVTLSVAPTVTVGYLYNQGSKNKEITGIKSIFATGGNLYGVPRSSIASLLPYTKSSTGTLDDVKIQEVIDRVENFANCTVDFIAMSQIAKYSYLDFLSSYKRNVDYMTTDTGFKAISFGGVPMVFERFVDSGTVYVMDTSTLKLHQLCDWRFLETENGNILRQAQDKPVYTATLVKYCDLICAKPNGLARLTGVTRA